jgi:hypothetical protein
VKPGQEALWTARPGLDDQSVIRLLDRVAGKVGAGVIRPYIPSDHYWPERSIKNSTSITEKAETDWRMDKPRPTELVKKPDPIEVMALIPDHPPKFFIYKGTKHGWSKLTVPSGSSANGGWTKVNTGIITRWKIARGNGIGCTVPAITMARANTNGLFTDFLFKAPWNTANCKSPQILASFAGHRIPMNWWTRQRHWVIKKIAITDRNTLAGIVRGYAAAKEKEIQIIPACRLDLLDGPSLLAYPTDKDAYCRLSALLTKGSLWAEKGECFLNKADVFEHAKGMLFTLVMPNQLNCHFNFEDAFIKHIGDYKKP